MSLVYCRAEKPEREIHVSLGKWVVLLITRNERVAVHGSINTHTALPSQASSLLQIVCNLQSAVSIITVTA